MSVATIEGFSFPDDLFYDAREHLWVRSGEGEVVSVGIDDGGRDALGDVVYVQLAAPGRTVARGEAIGSVEAEKMVRPLIAPVSGRLRETNAAVVETPRLLNRDPYGAWLFRIEAAEWERERASLLHGTEAVLAWVRAELSGHAKA